MPNSAMNEKFDTFRTLLSELSPMQFEAFVVLVLENAKDIYISVQTEHEFAGTRIDILGTTSSELHLFELKVGRRSVSQHAINHAVSLLGGAIERSDHGVKLIIVVNTPPSQEAVATAMHADVEIWNPSDIFNLINSQTSLDAVDVLQQFTKAPTRTCRDVLNEMIDERNMKTGAGKPAYKYQKLTIEIFSCLFSPPLIFVDEEVPDEGGKNRRDAIYENISDNHYWSVVRDQYKAMYVVIDAKNHKNKIPKNEVVKFSHYLKHYGCGQFGILICRKGLSSGARSAARDQWIGGAKMIIALSHNDLEIAVEMKELGQDPVGIIFEKIKQMRIIL